MDWDDIRYFLAVSRTGSIRGAATKLKVNHSTVSRRIGQLERKMDVRLFDKLPTGYIITPAGEEILEYAVQIEEQTHAIERKIVGRDTELSGTLRVTLTAALATHLLMPDFEKFSRRYANIHLELVISDEEFSLSKREADVAIRVTNGNPPDHLIGRQLLNVAMCTYASPDYIRRLDINNDPAAAHWLGWDDDETLPQWIKSSDFPDSPVKHQVNHILSQLAAARSGLGMSILPCFMGDKDPALQRVPGATPRPGRNIWLLTHGDLRQTARVRVFTEFMASAIRAQGELLLGHGNKSV